MPKQKAFSLIELMVAVVIIGILSTSLAIGMTKSKQQARDAQRIGDIILIGKAIDTASIQDNVYPTIIECLGQTSCPNHTLIGRKYDNGKSPLSKIDLSSLPFSKIPNDPRPVLNYKIEDPTAEQKNEILNTENSNDIMSGYFYSKYEPNDRNPNNYLKTFYTLEVGLESNKNQNQQLISAEQTNLNGIAPNPNSGRFIFKKEVNFNTTYARGSGTRYRFIFLGPSCNTNCY